MCVKCVCDCCDCYAVCDSRTRCFKKCNGQNNYILTFRTRVYFDGEHTYSYSK